MQRHKLLATGFVALAILSGSGEANAEDEPDWLVGPIFGSALARELAPLGRSGDDMVTPGSSVAGRHLFVSKGCVLCHAVNGVGGRSASPLDATAPLQPVDPFTFMARMWRGAEAKSCLQQQKPGVKLDFSGDELADIMAFLHDSEEQQMFSIRDLPQNTRTTDDRHDHADESETVWRRATM